MKFQQKTAPPAAAGGMNSPLLLWSVTQSALKLRFLMVFPSHKMIGMYDNVPSLWFRWGFGPWDPSNRENKRNSALSPLHSVAPRPIHLTKGMLRRQTVQKQSKIQTILHRF